MNKITSYTVGLVKGKRVFSASVYHFRILTLKNNWCTCNNYFRPSVTAVQAAECTQNDMHQDTELPRKNLNLVKIATIVVALPYKYYTRYIINFLLVEIASVLHPSRKSGHTIQSMLPFHALVSSYYFPADNYSFLH